MDTSRDFERRQLGTFAILWTSYAAYYLCRMNLSGAQATIARQYGFDKDQIGGIVAVFCVVYGMGQLVNGPLCDRFGARRMLSTGLIGSGLVSIAFSFANTLPAMGVLWALNGVFQSMGFAACVKTLASWFPLRQRGRVSGWFSLSYKTGNIAAWALTGWLVGYGWRWAFRVPGALMFLLAGYVLLKLEEAPPDGPDRRTATEFLPLASAAKWILKCPPLWIASLSCLSLALTSYGFLYWLPHYWSDTGSSAFVAGIKAACYPLGGCIGALTLGWISDHLAGGRRPPVVAAALLAGGVLVGLLPLIPDNMTTARILCVTVTGGLIMGGHAHICISIAMDVASQRTVGTATGFIDAMNYVGAAATAIGSGWIAERRGWDCAFFVWSAAACLAACLMALLWNHRPSAGDES